MEQICLQAIHKTNSSISYSFSFTEGLAPYFSGKPFLIEYPDDIERVPDSVACIPFVSCVLPIIWLTNAMLILPELDEDFYNCIPNVKKGYEQMFPESDFRGVIQADCIVKNVPSRSGGCGALFSGGVDATQTLVSHLDEQPHLISIWGSDISYDNEEGWKAVYSHIEDTAQRYHLPSVVIRSTFREFDIEGVLSSDFGKQLKDGWWHGVKHGIALLGHTAPYSYLSGLSTVYIASSFAPADGPVRCASDPSIDNYVRFSECQVVHDGFEYDRTSKTKNIVGFCNDTGNHVFLHVCWESETGENCCKCEKCYRTIATLLSENADPNKYGFYLQDDSLGKMQERVTNSSAFKSESTRLFWKGIQFNILQNKEILMNSNNWEYLKWIVKTDFLHYRERKASALYRLRSYLARYRFYQILHHIKENYDK